MFPIIETAQSYADFETIQCFIRRVVQQAWMELALDDQVRSSRLVVVKPNWIQEANENDPACWEALITHPTVLLAVVEAVADKMGGSGTIVICDAPHGYANFQKIIKRGNFFNGFERIRKSNPGITFEILDLRKTIQIRKLNVVTSRILNEPDPRGYVRFDLGRDSLFPNHKGEGKYYGADYDDKEVNLHHTGSTHEYLLSGTATGCDLFVNVPKLKTHKKTGMTCALKNLVGINGDKNWLPHHTKGAPSNGGDEFPEMGLASSFESKLKSLAQRMALKVPVAGPMVLRLGRKCGEALLGNSDTVIRNGNWQGNDTCWRMVLDLNRAFLYGQNNGNLSLAKKPRNYLCIVDGIIGGQGNGPLCPDPVDSGVLIAGTNPAEIDAISCRLMGFNPMDIPMVREAFSEHPMPLCRHGLLSTQVMDQRVQRILSIDQVAPENKQKGQLA